MEKEPKKKNIVQDIVPARRSIRNVELPSRAKIQSKTVDSFSQTEVISPKVINFEKVVPINKIPATEKIIPGTPAAPVFVPPNTSSYRYEYGDKPKSSKMIFYISLLVFLLVCAFGVSAFFKSAKITITPQNESHPLDSTTTFSAKKDNSGADLSFQIVTITKDLEKTVPSSSQQKVTTKSSGKITIYNSGTLSQKLVILTRFQTSDGLVYRITDSVTVPGGQLKSGKTVPGEAVASVLADEAGEKYNIGIKDFTIPGFKGTSKYTQITAKSKTEMTGGFSGMQMVVSEQDMSTINTELEKGLRDLLASNITLQIPDNFILYDNGISYTFSPVTQVSSAGGNVTLQKKGVAHAIIFDKGSLSRSIVSKLLPDVKNDIVKITNLEKLVFSYKDGSTFNPENSESLDFGLSGDAMFVWVFDENKLKSDILGLSKTQARAIIGGYKSIKEEWIDTNPFWNQTIPKDPKKVHLINTLSN